MYKNRNRKKYKETPIDAAKIKSFVLSIGVKIHNFKLEKINYFHY
jgi:hypothetical protein